MNTYHQCFARIRLQDSCNCKRKRCRRSKSGMYDPLLSKSRVRQEHYFKTATKNVTTQNATQTDACWCSENILNIDIGLHITWQEQQCVVNSARSYFQPVKRIIHRSTPTETGSLQAEAVQVVLCGNLSSSPAAATDLVLEHAKANIVLN